MSKKNTKMARVSNRFETKQTSRRKFLAGAAATVGGAAAAAVGFPIPRICAGFRLEGE